MIASWAASKLRHTERRFETAAGVPLGKYLALGKSDSTTAVTFIVENGVATGFEANDNGSRRTLKKIK